MEQESVLNELVEIAGNLKAILSLLYAANMEAVGQETFERICLMAAALVENLEKGFEELK